MRIKTISHQKQRYETPGDYWETSKVLEMRVSKLSDWRFEFLIVIHELIEYALVKQANLSLREIDEFDQMFERERAKGLHDDDAEPGMDKRAPYRKQHIWATRIERFVAFLLHVNWKKYDKEVISLLQK